jgi:hypothetical protein
MLALAAQMQAWHTGNAVADGSWLNDLLQTEN